MAFEVEIDDAVGLGEQARGLRRGLGAQKDGQGQQKQDRGNDEERSSGASAHAAMEEEPSGMSVTLAGCAGREDGPRRCAMDYSGMLIE